uniref:Uncharacterized protein n=1 Tax=Trichogramma kaykai TaxID=54128 RepID=A0ABD2WZZ3_9HYME
MRVLLFEHATSSRHHRIVEEKLRGNETLISYIYTHLPEGKVARAELFFYGCREQRQRRRQQDVQVLMQKFAKINQRRESAVASVENTKTYLAPRKKDTRIQS